MPTSFASPPLSGPGSTSFPGALAKGRLFPTGAAETRQLLDDGRAGHGHQLQPGKPRVRQNGTLPPTVRPSSWKRALTSSHFLAIPFNASAGPGPGGGQLPAEPAARGAKGDPRLLGDPSVLRQEALPGQTVRHCASRGWQSPTPAGRPGWKRPGPSATATDPSCRCAPLSSGFCPFLMLGALLLGIPLAGACCCWSSRGSPRQPRPLAPQPGLWHSAGLEPLGGGASTLGASGRHRPAARPGGRASLDALAAPPALPMLALPHVAFAIGIAFCSLLRLAAAPLPLLDLTHQPRTGKPSGSLGPWPHRGAHPQETPSCC